MDNRTKEVVAGALYDFMGYLTTRKEQLKLSAVDDSAPAAEITAKFLKLRNIEETITPDIRGWSTPQTEQRSGIGVGKRIKEERKKHKLTLQALADRIGTTKSYVWELENTETPNPTLRILVGLSKELNVSIDYLAKG